MTMRHGSPPALLLLLGCLVALASCAPQADAGSPPVEPSTTPPAVQPSHTPPAEAEPARASFDAHASRGTATPRGHAAPASDDERASATSPAARFDGIVVDLATQTLTLWEAGEALLRYPVSTSAVGAGSAAGSNRTPLGAHRIAETFGAGQPIGMRFVARRPTGEIVEILREPIDLEEDYVLTRVLWLEGLEPGINRGPGRDSHDRYIYIHGTNEEGLIGRPASHGCIRMRNADVVELFERVGVGTRVEIRDSES